jgi:hypothetical protein
VTWASLGRGVDQDVDSAKRSHRAFDQRFHRGVAFGVDAKGDDLAPGLGGERPCGRLEFGHATRGDDHIGPLTRQLQGDRPADALAAAGDQRALALKL